MPERQRVEFGESELGKALLATPVGFVDVGARGEPFAPLLPYASCVTALLVEPDAEACQLAARQSPWRSTIAAPVALAESSGTRPFYRVSAATNDSLLPIDEKWVERYAMHPKWTTVSTTHVTVQRLDELLKSHRFRCEFLKLDTQGSEFEVLQGADLTSVMAVFTEVSFFPIYAGQRLFSEVELLLRSHGFCFYGFHEPRLRSRRRVAASQERWMSADAVFFREPPVDSERQRQVLALACLALGYLDLALEVWPAAEQLDSLH